MLRRQIPGARRIAPEAAVAEDRVRLALRKAQRKLLDAQWKLESNIEALRAKLAARQ